MTQVRDCTTAITLKTPVNVVNQKDVDYDSSSTKYEITSNTATSGWNDLFDNANENAAPEGCAIT